MIPTKNYANPRTNTMFINMFSLMVSMMHLFRNAARSALVGLCWPHTLHTHTHARAPFGATRFDLAQADTINDKLSFPSLVVLLGALLRVLWSAYRRGFHISLTQPDYLWHFNGMLTVSFISFFDSRVSHTHMALHWEDAHGMLRLFWCIISFTLGRLN